jgi:hypothetical protein
MLRAQRTQTSNAPFAAGALSRALVFRCPFTAQRVQAWDDPATDASEQHIFVHCLACQRMHLVDRETGKVIGAGDD